MSTEHHIDSFDVGSFFQLHDLNRDGIWDREEIEAVYGVHHVYSQKKSKDEVEHQKKADHIVDTVLSLLDKNNDAKITLDELKAVGLDGLPNFEDLGAEGHHYDVESEFFLHHEEQFHSTPETQTDDAYNHPEDLEHFAHHEQIEREEAAKEAKFQGITVDEALAQHEPHDEPATPPAGDEMQDPVDETFGGEHAVVDPPSAGIPKFTRVPDPEKMDPIERFKKAKAAGDGGEWGQGDSGYKSPVSPSDRLKKNLPYKDRMQYKFRRAWGDF
ncbi:hypothetical protein EW026_g5827 [Hermanssonia centrifuga]|uniref:EF-hand domain-containing protein n=1 Tax=Hermanssonia centrifuga TaxID=98765 RepID=A0A4S4KEM8_9APHY|nr:hypothetical protein EW026_g5827 [Hermanssonia centrifuga]